jgi:hypothetical protein
LKLPHDLPGTELVSLLGRHGYEITRQTGSYLRLTSWAKGSELHITISRHKHLRVGTSNVLPTSIASYLGMDRRELIEELFGGQQHRSGW